MFNKHESYEKKVQTAYSELGRENIADKDTWGNAVMDGQNINVYNDPNFIKKNISSPLLADHFDKNAQLTLVDFGGAEGHVLKSVTEDFRSQGYQHINPLDLDINSSNLQLVAAELSPTRSDLLSLPLKNDSVDAGILRFVLPYNIKKDQELILQNINQALKTGGRLVLLQDGAYNLEQGASYNEFYAQASAAQGGKSLAEIKGSRYFASGEELVEMAQKAGFKVSEARELSEIESYFSPQAYASRFQMDQTQVANLQKVFQDWEKSGKLEFSAGRLKRIMLRLILDK
jgi:SAM-dependent methyltransferase